MARTREAEGIQQRRGPEEEAGLCIGPPRGARYVCQQAATLAAASQSCMQRGPFCCLFLCLRVVCRLSVFGVSYAHQHGCLPPPDQTPQGWQTSAAHTRASTLRSSLSGDVTGYSFSPLPPPPSVQGVTRSTLISSYNWLAMELKARNRSEPTTVCEAVRHHRFTFTAECDNRFTNVALYRPSLLLPMLTCSSGLTRPPPLLPFVLRSLAFCGPASCAVAHAEKYLQDEVIRCAPDIGSGPNKEVFYPNLVPTNILGLVHHKNQIISTFLMESVVGEGTCDVCTLHVHDMDRQDVVCGRFVPCTRSL